MSTKRRFDTCAPDQSTARRRAIAEAVQSHLDDYEDVLRFLKAGVTGDEFNTYLGQFLGHSELKDIATNLHSVDACLRPCEEIDVSPAAQRGKFRVELTQEGSEAQAYFSTSPELAAACCLVAQRQVEIYSAWLLNRDGGYDLANPSYVPSPVFPCAARSAPLPRNPPHKPLESA